MLAVSRIARLLVVSRWSHILEDCFGGRRG